MADGSKVTQAGLRDNDFTIDGVSIKVPSVFDFNPRRRQSPSTVANGLRRVDLPDDGIGLPDAADVFDFALKYQIGTSTSGIEDPDLNVLEKLRTMGGSHAFVCWKKFRVIFTTYAGQVVFYLPRADAFGRSYSGKTATTYKAEVTVNGVPIAAANTKYDFATVDAATVVGVNDVQISTGNAIDHPDAIITRVAPLKFGASIAPTAGQQVIIDYHPVFNVLVDSVSTQSFADAVGREDKQMVLLESAT
jgi:hypothetical protein